MRTRQDVPDLTSLGIDPVAHSRPSETHLLTWADIDFAKARLLVRSPKTERFRGHQQRLVPIVPRLMRLLEEWFDLAPDGQARLITIKSPSGRRRKMRAVMDKAKVERWDDTWQTLRRSCEIEWAQKLPAVRGLEVDRTQGLGRLSALRQRDPGGTVCEGRGSAGDAKSDAACSRTGPHRAAGRKTGFGGRLAQRRHVPGLRGSATLCESGRKWSRGESNPRAETVSSALLRVCPVD
jgi:hypothetical protein